MKANITRLVNVITSEYWKNMLQYLKRNIRGEVESLFELILRREESEEWNEVICLRNPNRNPVTLAFFSCPHRSAKCWQGE